MKKISVLITAVGSELSFSIIKALKISRLKYTLVGCDIYKEVVGKYWCDYFENVPLAKEEEKYIQALIKIIRKYQIRILIPTADIEFFILSRYKKQFWKQYNCHILIDNEKEIKTFNDKWLAYQFFQQKKINTPVSMLANDINIFLQKDNQLKFPVIIKPRTGGGSRHIYKANNNDELKKYVQVVPEPIIQEYAYPDDQEYTAGTYRSIIDDEVYVIIMNRILKFGMTNFAETIQNIKLEKFCKNVIQKTDLIGSNNIQFILTKAGPKVLEINPRFSGTTGVRANFGFNDAEMWINESLGNKIHKPKIKKGFVLRFMEEQYHFKHRTNSTKLI
ncbi:MAG: ATP-grasp domain-containing protein [Bacteroidota bacterium]